MKFSDRKNELDILLNHLEKVAKILMVKVDKENEISVQKGLEWLEDSFNKLLRLKDDNPQKFDYLVNPNKYYTPSTDLSPEEIDWNSIEIKDQQISDPERLYDPFPGSNQSTRGILSSYVQNLYKIWYKASQKKQYGISNACRYILGNWLYTLIRLESDNDIEIEKVLDDFLNETNKLNIDALLKQEISSQESYFSPIFLYINIIFSQSFKIKYLNIFYDKTFEGLVIIVQRNHDELYKDFVRRSNSQSPSVSHDGQSKLIRLLLSNNQIEPKKKQSIRQEASFLKEKLDIIYSLEALDNWKNELDRFANNLQEIISDRNKIEIIEGYKKAADQIIKYNYLRFCTYRILTYCIFKEKFDLVEYTLQFNQPPDSDAVWANVDIIPNDYFTILLAITQKHKLAHSLLFFWEGHHGVRPYVEKFLLLLIVRKLRDIEQPSIKKFLEKLASSSSELEGLKQSIEGIEKHLEEPRNSEFYQRFLNEKKIGFARDFFESVKSEIDKHKEKEEVTSPLNDVLIESLKKGIITEYQKNALVRELIKQHGTIEDLTGSKNIAQEDLVYGINELKNRTAFIENWHVPYYGLPEGFGRHLADIENIALLNRYVKFIGKNVQNVYEHELIEKFKKGKINLRGKFLLGHNIYFDDFFRDFDNYTPTYLEEHPSKYLDLFFIGTLNRSIKIYSIYDRSGLKRVFVLPEKQIGTLKQNKIKNAEKYELIGQGIYCKFTDLAKEEGAREYFLENPPEWLKNKGDQREQNKFLMKKVWIRIYQNFELQINENFKGEIFSIK